MKIFAFATFLFATLGLAFSEITLDGDVLVLDSSNFDEAVKLHEQILVEFYAPWCGHCKTLAPEWAKAATALKASSVKLAKVDATESKDLATEYGVQGFPTIKFFKKGKASEYSGGRQSADIVSWANKKSGPVARPVNSEEDLVVLQEANDAVVLGVFASSDSANARSFLSLAGDSEDDVYAITSADAVRTKLGVSEDTVVVLKSFDNKRSDLVIGAEFDASAVSEFVTAESVPLIREFTQESSRKIFKSPITKHALVFTKKSESHHESTISTATAVAQKFKGKVLFVSVVASADTQRVLDYFDIKDNQLPLIILADMNPAGGSMKKYPFTGAIEEEAVTSFFTDYFDGKLKPVLKSEEPVAADTAGDVVVVKGKSFNEIIIDNNKDIFLEFYAPWCGHCKSLAPTWDALGKKFSSLKEHVTIAKMDATANEIDHEKLVAKGFPTIFFIKGNDKANPIKYEGGRELDDLVDYIKEHASNKFDHDEL